MVGVTLGVSVGVLVAVGVGVKVAVAVAILVGGAVRVAVGVGLLNQRPKWLIAARNTSEPSTIRPRRM